MLTTRFLPKAEHRHAVPKLSKRVLAVLVKKKSVRSVRQLKKIQVCGREVGQSAPGGSGDFVPLPLLRAADVNDKTAL